MKGDEEHIPRKVLRTDIGAYQGEPREDDRKQDGTTRANETGQVLD